MQPFAPNAPSKAEALVAALRAYNTSLCHDAADEIERLRKQEYRMAARIHHQRVALRENWEIIEMRAQYRRAWYPSKLLRSMLRRHCTRPMPWWRRMFT